MASYCKLTIIGHVGRDPEQRHLPNGDLVADFTVPYTERKRDQSGEWSDGLTAWYRVSAFGTLAERAMEQLHIGTNVYLEGVLLPREYTDREGRTRMSLDVRVREMRVLGKRSESGAETGRAPGPEPVGGAEDEAGDPYTSLPF